MRGILVESPGFMHVFAGRNSSVFKLVEISLNA